MRAGALGCWGVLRRCVCARGADPGSGGCACAGGWGVLGGVSAGWGVLGGVCGGGERTDMPLDSAFFDTKTTMPSVLSTCIVGTNPLH